MNVTTKSRVGYTVYKKLCHENFSQDQAGDYEIAKLD
jgi:hypothetical protein